VTFEEQVHVFVTGQEVPDTQHKVKEDSLETPAAAAAAAGVAATLG
jgi:hypothetical protein